MAAPIPLDSQKLYLNDEGEPNLWTLQSRYRTSLGAVSDSDLLLGLLKAHAGIPVLKPFLRYLLKSDGYTDSVYNRWDRPSSMDVLQ